MWGWKLGRSGRPGGWRLGGSGERLGREAQGVLEARAGEWAWAGAVGVVGVGVGGGIGGTSGKGGAGEVGGAVGKGGGMGSDAGPFVGPTCANGSTKLPAGAPLLTPGVWKDISPKGPKYGWGSENIFVQGMAIIRAIPPRST